MSLTEDSIAFGIIQNNIAYFIQNFKKYKDNEIFSNYFNDYINGELVDVNDVYNTILNKILKEHNNDVFVEICDYCLTEEIYINFIEKFSVYLSSQTISYNYIYNLITLFLNRPNLNTYISKIDLTASLNILINKNDVHKPKSRSFNTFDIFLKLLKNKDVRNKIIDYFGDHIQKCKENKMIKSFIDIEPGNTCPYIFQINLCLLLIDLWLNGITNDKLKQISSTETKYLSITFYQIQDMLEYTLIKIYDEKKIRIKEISKVKELIEINKDVNYVSYNMYKTLKGEIETYLNILYVIISTKEIIIINKFYDNTIWWLNTKNQDQEDQEDQECYNDILENMYIFYKNNKNEMTNNMTELYENIFLGNITNNPNIKINYMSLFHNYLLEIVYYNSKTIAIPNFVNYDKNISRITLSLLELSSSMKKSFNSDQIYNMLYPMSLLANIFNLTVYNVDDYKYYFNETINTKYFKELIYDNINNFQYVVDEILDQLNKINKIENSDEQDEDVEDMDDIKNKINNLDIYFNVFSTFIIKTSKFYTTIILGDEIKHCLNNVIVCIINKLTISQKKYKVKDKTNLKFNPIDLLDTIKSILLNLIYIRNNENNVVLLFSENDNYNKNSITRFINILNKKNKIKVLDYNYLSFLDKKINVKLKLNKDIEIPDELCDPIMDTLMENPIMLPNNIIIDYGTISRHLLNNETNPFNRDPLTLEILDEYNKSVDIKTQIDVFKEKVLEFKRENNM